MSLSVRCYSTSVGKRFRFDFHPRRQFRAHMSHGLTIVQLKVRQRPGTRCHCDTLTNVRPVPLFPGGKRLPLGPRRCPFRGCRRLGCPPPEFRQPRITRHEECDIRSAQKGHMVRSTITVIRLDIGLPSDWSLVHHQIQPWIPFTVQLLRGFDVIVLPTI